MEPPFSPDDPLAHKRAHRVYRFYPPQKLAQEARKRGDKLVSARDAYRILQISEAEFHRRARDGVYPYLQDTHTSRKWFFLKGLERKGINEDDAPPVPDELRTQDTLYVPKWRRGKETGEETMMPAASSKKNVTAAKEPISTYYTPTAAKEGFLALSKGKSSIELVSELGIHPVAARQIEADFVAMKGGFVLSQKSRQAIESLPLRGEGLFESEESFVRLLAANLAAPNPCGRCAREKARICTSCANELQQGAALGMKVG